MINKSDAIIIGLSIPKFFKLSFSMWIDMWIGLNEKMSTFQKILYVTNDVTESDCGNQILTVDVAMQSENHFNLQHNFKCLNGLGSYNRISERFELSAGEWYRIEYEQIPIFNEDGTTSISEIIIRINDQITSKITNFFPKQYNNIKLYYGKAKREQEGFFKLGKIKNFKLSEFIQGESLIFHHLSC